MLTAPGTFVSNDKTLPPQMISQKEKDEEWGMDTMDSLESIANVHRGRNLKLIENYEMVKGKFIFSHYFGDDGYDGMLNQLAREFELPNYLKHYDIISPVINTLLGEWQKQPDIYRVKDWSEHGTNEYLRVKTDFLRKHVQDTINIEINKALINQGLADVQPQSEEEAQQLEQQIESIRQSMTPPEIESYMKTDFRTAGELWGQHRLEADKQRFNLKEKERREFEDMIISDRCFRHFFLTSNGYSQETWNPVQVFYHKSPEVEYIEDGDYVGRTFLLTISDIIDRYGYLMTEKQLSSLQGDKPKDKTRWAEAKGTSYVYENYMTPFQGHQGYAIAKGVNDFYNTGAGDGVPYFDSQSLNNITNSGFFTNTNGFYQVTEGYWKSYEKISMICYTDEDGIIIKKLVDEHYIIPKHFKKVELLFSDEMEVNTITSTWVTRVYKGKKINLGDRSRSIYFDIQPLEFQFKGDLNIYNAKLPVCGQVFSIRNSQSMSLVDLMKPHQIGYNVAMNQLYQFMEKEIGAFVVFDVNMFPNAKDWGGEDSYGKWMTVAKSLGMLPLDTSPQNMKGAASAAGGQYPKILDLQTGAQMISRMNIAKFFEEQALKQIGFNAYRLGNYASTSTAAGIEQGQQQSYSQTDSYFTNFSNYLRRCYRMNLDIAQFVESRNEDISISYTQNDLSNAFIKVMGTDLLLADLYLFVSNNQEMLRQLESLRQLGLNNNTSGASIADLAEIITTNSPQNIINILKQSVEKQQAMQAKEQELKQVDIENNKQIAEMQEAKLDERLDKTIQKELQVAEIAANSKIFFNKNYNPSEEDINSAQESLDAHALKQDKLQQDGDLKSRQLQNDHDFKTQKIALENKKIDAQIQKEKEDITYAKIMKGKKP